MGIILVLRFEAGCLNSTLTVCSRNQVWKPGHLKVFRTLLTLLYTTKVPNREKPPDKEFLVYRHGLLTNFYSLKLYLLSNGFSVETQHIAFWRKKFWVNVFENWVSNLDSSTLAIKIQTKQTVISINIQWVSLLIFRKFWKNEQKGIPKAVSSEFWSLKFEIGQIKFIRSLTMKSERSLVCHLFILV
jgi:hypothetical protein